VKVLERERKRGKIGSGSSLSPPLSPSLSLPLRKRERRGKSFPLGERNVCLANSQVLCFTLREKRTMLQNYTFLHHPSTPLPATPVLHLNCMFLQLLLHRLCRLPANPHTILLLHYSNLLHHSYLLPHLLCTYITTPVIYISKLHILLHFKTFYIN